ncbi:MAG: YqjK-like family protein [Methylotenera sp.]|nr:YqjK-like family protein [Methylotenera sp.]
MIKGLYRSQKLSLLAERRRKLINKAAAQRVLLSVEMEPLKKPLAVADRGLEIFHFFRQHPILMLGVTSVISAINPSRISKWLQTSLSVLQLARSISTFIIKK